MNHLVTGVGVGPSNLSLASLIYDVNSISNIFFERKRIFDWHSEMDFGNAQLQVSWLKDLVTLEDPTNKFSFLSYLKNKGRIYHFVNSQFESVARAEYADYLKWACNSNQNIHLNEEVEDITFDGNFQIITSKRQVTAKNVVVGVGSQPYVPDIASEQMGVTQTHVSRFQKIQRSCGGKRVVIIGGGQSGAEAVLSLLNCEEALKPSRLIWISRRENFFPIDDTPFTNDFFMPCYSEFFYRKEIDYKRNFNRRNVLASDGISPQTLRDIYQSLYRTKFVCLSKTKIEFLPGRDVISSSSNAKEHEIVTKQQYGTTREVFLGDFVVWATGFRPANSPFLDTVSNRFSWIDNEIEVDEDFAVKWDGPTGRNIFLQNASKNQWGLADPNLSLLAWRSARIMQRLLGRKFSNRTGYRSFVSWGPDGNTLPHSGSADLSS